MKQDSEQEQEAGDGVRSDPPRARTAVVAGPVPRTVAERVMAIVAIMRAGAWVRGDTGRELAMLWRCSLASVRDAAKEASRLERGLTIDSTREDLEEHARLLRVAEELAVQAEEPSRGAAVVVGIAKELREARGIGTSAPKQVVEQPPEPEDDGRWMVDDEEAEP